MLNLLLKPLLGVASQAVTGFVETKKAKAESKLVEIKAKTALREKQIAGEISWEASAVDQMKGSWKDEFWTLIFGGILISCFLPWTQSYVAEGFVFLIPIPQIGLLLVYTFVLVVHLDIDLVKQV
jgi:hypothetical protein